MNQDIWDKEFRSINFPNKEKLKKQIKRYGGPVRFWLGKIVTSEILKPT
jgi:hypothetical protein